MSVPKDYVTVLTALEDFVLELERRTIEHPRSDLASIQPLCSTVSSIAEDFEAIPAQFLPRLRQLGCALWNIAVSFKNVYFCANGGQSQLDEDKQRACLSWIASLRFSASETIHVISRRIKTEENCVLLCDMMINTASEFLSLPITNEIATKTEYLLKTGFDALEEIAPHAQVVTGKFQGKPAPRLWCSAFLARSKLAWHKSQQEAALRSMKDSITVSSFVGGASDLLFKHYATAYNWAVDLHDRHQFMDAITWLRHAEEVASSEEGNVVGPERLARCMRLEAQCLRQIGDLEAARSSLVKANSVFENPSGLFDLSSLEDTLGADPQTIQQTLLRLLRSPHLPLPLARQVVEFVAEKAWEEFSLTVQSMLFETLEQDEDRGSLIVWNLEATKRGAGGWPRVFERAQLLVQTQWLSQLSLQAQDRVLDWVLDSAHFLFEERKVGLCADLLRCGLRLAENSGSRKLDLLKFTARCSLKQGLPRDALELATQTIRLGGDWNSHLLLKGLAQIDLHEADDVVDLIQAIVLSDRQMDDIELGVVLEALAKRAHKRKEHFVCYKALMALFVSPTVQTDTRQRAVCNLLRLMLSSSVHEQKIPILETLQLIIQKPQNLSQIVSNGGAEFVDHTAHQLYSIGIGKFDQRQFQDAISILHIAWTMASFNPKTTENVELMISCKVIEVLSLSSDLDQRLKSPTLDPQTRSSLLQTVSKKVGDFEVLRADLAQNAGWNQRSLTFRRAIVTVGIVELKLNIILQQQDVLPSARALLAADTMTSDIAQMMAEVALFAGSQCLFSQPSHLVVAQEAFRTALRMVISEGERADWKVVAHIFRRLVEISANNEQELTIIKEVLSFVTQHPHRFPPQPLLWFGVRSWNTAVVHYRRSQFGAAEAWGSMALQILGFHPQSAEYLQVMRSGYSEILVKLNVGI